MRYGAGHKSFEPGETRKHFASRLDSEQFQVEIDLPPHLWNMKWEFVGMDRPWHGRINFETQIGLWPMNKGIPIFVTNSELANKPIDQSAYRCDQQHPVLVFASSKEAKILIVNTITQQGLMIDFIEDIHLPHNIVAEMVFALDKTKARFLANLAFNYLAHELGADFAATVDFSAIRSFIREGQGNTNTFVQPDEQPILWYEQGTRRRISIHLLAIEWAQRTQQIISRVSLYGARSYRIILASKYTGLYRPDLNRGCGFDWRKHEVYKLLSATGLVLPRIH